MSHMQDQITCKCDWLEVESTRYGTGWIVAEHVSEWPIPLDVEVPGYFINEDLLRKIIQYTEIPSVEHVDYVKLIKGYGARLSAPGYLDCTEWCVFNTLKGARDYLKEQED